MNGYRYIYIVMALCAAALHGCGNGEKSGKPVVTVTIEPLRYFTEAVAGDKFRVTTLVPKGSSPETYEPTPQQMAALAESRLYIKVGEIGFERTWMDKIRDNATGIKVIDSSEHIILKRTSNGIHDPHTWMSCRNAEIISANICKALAEYDPDNKAYYKANLERLKEKIYDTKAKILGMKHKSDTFLIYHPSLTYFAQEFGLFQLPVEEEGREPGARQIQDIIETARSRNARVMFVQKEFSNRNVETITKAVKATTVEINPLSYDWHGEMMKVAKALK